MDMLKIAYDIGLQTAFEEEFGKEAVDWEALFPTFRNWLGIAPGMGHNVANVGTAKRLIQSGAEAARPGRSFSAVMPRAAKPTAAGAARKLTNADIAAANARSRFAAQQGASA